ncbi:TRAP transporter large permease (plasmid) [Thalassobaculum sp. OXR-137]|uniref:TRAP transporter large permease n=1 Tax=Thalassobaculum sp. OXR-137 TaxID=3100173 RepID=UPI002AC9AD0E|nr:TRAP transporter large permease [Thalassobaculum sp. OXR-137]WPZ37184.1 TRAP transporter large permease [Thalassobaculum sp. OXR-137]
MTYETVAIVVSIVFLLFLSSGVWVAVALGLSGFALYIFRDGWSGVQSVGFLIFNSLESYDYVALPLFVFLATILSSCGIAGRLYAFSAALFGRFPGGLLHANIAGSAMFSSVCGSTAATCAAMGTIAVPELRRRKYPEGIAVGTLAAGGTLGPMIPPSLAFIVYGVLTDTSIGQLFVAGIIPGIVLSALFMGYIYIRCRIKKDVPVETDVPRGEVLRLALGVWPVLALFVGILGGMYFGVFTAVEAGAVGCLASLAIAAASGGLTWANLRTALREGTHISGMIMFVLVGGMLLGHGFSNMGIPQQMVAAVSDAGLGPIQFIMVLTVLYLLLGMFLDGSAVLVVTMPLVFPVAVAMGFDPVWFGVLVIIFCEMAAITPPVGVNLSVLQGVTRAPLEVIALGAAPFLVLLVVMVGLIVAFPDVVMFLPKMMY